MSEERISGYQIYQGFLSGYFSISTQREHLNSINVFPVPDGDTGSNMVRTFRSIAGGMVSTRSASGTLNRIADLSLEGARGNSGMILSQFINGMARHLDQHHLVAVPVFGEAVRKSVDSAYKAMDSPREGTMLTVIAEWASEIYKGSRKGLSYAEIFTRAFTSADDAVKRTPGQLKILKDNGVVDAGALGFVSFLRGIEMLKTRGFVPFRARREISDGDSTGLKGEIRQYHFVPQDIQNRYCTEVLLGHPLVPEEVLKEELRPLGDSLIVGRGRDSYRIHIHSSRPQDVVRILSRSGRVLQQKADDMVRQEQMNHIEQGRVGVLTDSIADIPLEIMDRYRIHVVNLKLFWDDDEYLDRLTITPEEFYRLQSERRKSQSPERVRRRTSQSETYRLSGQRRPGHRL